MARLYLVAGHGQGDPGAVNGSHQEATIVRTITNKLYDTCKNKVTTSLYPTNKNLYLTKDYNIFPSDSEVIEIHLNAHSDKSANGTEVLIKSGFSADPLDKALLAAMETYFTKRGFKYRNDLANMNNFASRGISYRLIEVCFISNTNDINKLNTNMNAIVNKIANAILTTMGASTGGSTGGNTTTTELYRVRKTWADAASQIGAFSSLESAKSLCDKNSGYSIFNAAGTKVYPNASTVNYVVRVTTDVLNIRSGPGTNYATTGSVTKNQAFTIIEVNNGWGKLKSGAGWISLEYTVRA